MEPGNPVARDVFTWIGSIVVIMLFTAPMKDIFGRTGVVRNKNTNNLATGFPYFSSIFNCVAWALYFFPVFDNNVLPTLINVYGAVTNFIYAACYWRYTTSEQSKQCLKFTIVGITLITPCILAEFLYKREVMGYVAACMNILMYYSPLAAASEVIKTKSVAKFPFLPLLFTFITSVSFTMFGILTPDIPILIANVCGVVFGLVQLAIYFYYSKNTAETPNPTAVQEVDKSATALETA